MGQHMTDTFPNPETAWHTEQDTLSIDRQDIIDRIGPCSEPIQPLSGGLANAAYRIGIDRVIRIYLRDTAALTKEAALLSRPWQSLRTPTVLERGADFLVLEYVPHGPLENSEEHGRLAGEALAEIHDRPFKTFGLLDEGFQIVQPFPDFVGSMSAYISSVGRNYGEQIIFDRMAESLMAAQPSLDPFLQSPVRLHGDFKPSNLHGTGSGQLLVLDWEFTYSGPALMDLAQLARWGMPDPFRRAFESAYRGNGGQIDADWQRHAELLDLVNLAGLLAKSDRPSTRYEDLRKQIETCLERYQSG